MIVHFLFLQSWESIESCREICLRKEQGMFRIIFRHKRFSFIVSLFSMDGTLFLLLLYLLLCGISKNWSWSWNSNTMDIWCEELTHWKRSWCWERWKVEKLTTEDEMVGCHHRHDGQNLSRFRELVMGREAWCASVHGVAKSQTWLSNWTDME